VLPSLCGGDIRFNFLQIKTASSTYDQLLTKEQILETRLNSRIAYKAPNTTGTRTYPIQLFCDNDDKTVNKHAIPVCLYNGVWHQIAYDSDSGLPLLRQPLTSVHIFDIEGTSTAKAESANSDSEPEAEEDSDEELAKQTGELTIDNQIRDTRIPRELTPQRDTVSLPWHTKLLPISQKLSTMATTSITIQQPTDTQPLTQGGGDGSSSKGKGSGSGTTGTGSMTTTTATGTAASVNSKLKASLG